MEKLPWWTEEQRRLADEVADFIDGLMPRIDEAYWKKEFPWDAVERITVRIPTDIYERIKAVKQGNLHLSLNAIMVELIARSLQNQKCKEQDHANVSVSNY